MPLARGSIVQAVGGGVGVRRRLSDEECLGTAELREDSKRPGGARNMAGCGGLDGPCLSKERALWPSCKGWMGTM